MRGTGGAGASSGARDQDATEEVRVTLTELTWSRVIVNSGCERCTQSTRNLGCCVNCDVIVAMLSYMLGFSLVCRYCFAPIFSSVSLIAI